MNNVKLYEDDFILVEQEEGEGGQIAIVIANKIESKMALVIHALGTGFMIAGNATFKPMAKNPTEDKRISCIAAVPKK